MPSRRRSWNSWGRRLATTAWSRTDGFEGATRLLDSGVAFDAVFALNDSQAIGALAAFRQRGLHVPDDVAVVGFDDIDEAAVHDPPLTSVAIGTAELAAVAVQMARRRIAEVDLPRVERTPYERFYAPASLVVRESTTGRTPPAGDPAPRNDGHDRALGPAHVHERTTPRDALEVDDGAAAHRP